MKYAESLLACCVVGLACFIGGQTVGVGGISVHDEAGGTIAGRAQRSASFARAARFDPEGRTGGNVSAGAGNDAGTRASDRGDAMLIAGRAREERAGTERPRATAEELRRRISLGMSGTYIDELLVARDSAIARWPDRVTRPLRVFVRDGDVLESWNPDFVNAVRDAFDTWVQAGIPVRFTYVRDSASADIHVRFIDKFANGISGKTVWSRDGNHWLLSSDIQLAVLHPNGGTVTPPQMRAIALHEVGHLLGLDHTDDTGNIMSARVRVRELSEQDRATIRLIYGGPAGSLK